MTSVAHILGGLGVCSPEKSFHEMMQFGAFDVCLFRLCLKKLPIFYI